MYASDGEGLTGERGEGGGEAVSWLNVSIPLINAYPFARAAAALPGCPASESMMSGRQSAATTGRSGLLSLAAASVHRVVVFCCRRGKDVVRSE